MFFVKNNKIYITHSQTKHVINVILYDVYHSRFTKAITSYSFSCVSKINASSLIQLEMGKRFPYFNLQAL